MKHIIRAKFPEDKEFTTIPSKIKALIEKNPDECFDFVIGESVRIKQKDGTITTKWKNQKGIKTKNSVGEKFIIKLKTASYEVEVIENGYCKIKKQETKINEVLTFTQFLNNYEVL